VLTKKYMLTNLRQSIFILLVLVILALTSCNKQVTSNSSFDADEILNYMSYQQSDDGGFADQISLSIISYIDYYDTYCALYVLDIIGYELTDSQHAKTLGFIEKIDFNALLDIEDNLDIVFFSLRIANMLNYELREKDLERMHDYIASLQTQDGYFVNSLARKELYNKGELEIELLSSINLFSIANIIELSKTYDIDLDYENLAAYLKLFLNEETMDSTRIAAIALLIKAEDLWGFHIDESTIADIKKLYTEAIMGNPMTRLDIGSLYNLLIINNYLGADDHSLIHEALQSYFNENGFSPFAGAENHIMATRIALLAFSDMPAVLEKSAINSIVYNVLDNQFYDGRFVFGRKDIDDSSRIEDTYNAMLLLKELGALDMYSDDLKRFYHARLEGTALNTNSLYDAFYLISTAIHCDASIDEYDVVEFLNNFSEYVNEARVLDYQFAISVVEHPGIWSVPYSDDIRDRLIVSSKRELSIQNYLTEFLALYYRYAVHKAMGLEYAHYYDDVINYFNTNYDKLENIIFASKYVVRIIEDEQLPLNTIKNRQKIIREINRCRDGILFSYVDDFHGTFDSTASIIGVIRNLSEASSIK